MWNGLIPPKWPPHTFDLVQRVSHVNSCQICHILVAHLSKVKGANWRTVLSDWRDWTNLSNFGQLGRQYFFRAHCAFFNFNSYVLTLFTCFFVSFQSCCSHAQVFGRTLVHEFHFLYCHTDRNLLFPKISTLWHGATWDNSKASIKRETERKRVKGI